MPNRILRDWTDSEAIDSLEWQAEVLLVRIIMKADDHGRFTAHPKLLRSLCFPHRDDVREADISRWLAACQKAGVVRLYEAGGKALLEIAKFGQRVRSDSKYASPPSNGSTPPSNDGLGECVVGGVVGGECGARAPAADAVIPTAQEVVTFGKGCTPVIPESFCLHQHAKHTEDHRWLVSGRLIDWRAKFRRYWSQDKDAWGQRAQSSAKPAAAKKKDWGTEV